MQDPVYRIKMLEAQRKRREKERLEEKGKREEEKTDRIDEPLPRLPLKVHPIKVRLKLSGKGKSTFRIAEDEINFDDDGQ